MTNTLITQENIIQNYFISYLLKIYITNIIHKLGLVKLSWISQNVCYAYQSTGWEVKRDFQFKKFHIHWLLIWGSLDLIQSESTSYVGVIRSHSTWVMGRKRVTSLVVAIHSSFLKENKSEGKKGQWEDILFSITCLKLYYQQLRLKMNTMQKQWTKDTRRKCNLTMSDPASYRVPHQFGRQSQLSPKFKVIY